MAKQRDRRRTGDRWARETSEAPTTEAVGGAPLTLVQRCGDIVVLGAAGDWSEVTRMLAAEAEVALAEAPRAVVVDLSAAEGSLSEPGIDRLMDLGERVRDWPGTALAVTSPSASVRSRLRRHPMSLFVHVARAVDRAVATVAADDPVQRVSLSLQPQARAARAACDAVSRACLDWDLAAAIPPACTVVSELVSNGVLHAGTALEVTLARLDGWLRLAVRDGSPTPPLPQSPSDRRLAGRGLLIVDGLAHAWGSTPTEDAGKIVWAVLAVSTP